MVAATANAADYFHQPLTVLPGIGPRRATQLEAALGVRSLGGLLRIVPRGYEDAPRRATLAEMQEGERVRVAVEVRSTSVWRRGGRSTLQVRVRDDSGSAVAFYFNQPYLRDAFPKGRRVVLQGRASLAKGPRLYGPSVVKDEDGGCGLEARYPDVEGVPGGLLARALAAALDALPPDGEPLPEELLALAEVPPLGRALRAVHRPGTRAEAEAGRRRLAWGEVLRLELRRQAARPRASAPRRATDPRIWERIRRRIPFALSAEQEEVLARLRRDLEQGSPMARLLHGEVGSGKTVVAFALALALAAEGGQTALLAPTEILARQHLRTFRSWLSGSRVQVVGLLGDDTAAERRRAQRALSDGAAIAVGTHALFGPAVRFRCLELVVFDEQHRFGVRQKAALVAKGSAPHVLTMTATPIPRTLAWARYGALDPCVLRRRPGGGGALRTVVCDRASWDEVAAAWTERLLRRDKAFVVVPRIEGENGLLRHAAELQSGPWSELPVEVVHGRMAGAEVAAAVARFANGASRVLLGTTIVEVGLDVPSVPLMAVLDAQRLGLASLHQLRGRLARGADAGDGECWLFGESGSLERLRTLESCTDGFAVAEADLRERGPGALRGVRQHGRSDFLVFDAERDADLVEKLREPPVRAWLEAEAAAREQRRD